MNVFSSALLHWFEINGRKNLPWQCPKIPYRVWVSEIMLQQTQVKTVIPFFERFMQRFPDLHALATASEDDVLSLWAGLGYYSRGRNLHKTAQIICSTYNGVFPNEVAVLIALPGIGQSTAAAISSLAFNQATPILDANVIRVLSRYFLVSDDPTKAAIKRRFWQLAEQCMPDKSCSEYTQAIMDFGATQCTPKKPRCENCPMQSHCLAYQQGNPEDYPYKQKKKVLPIQKKHFFIFYDSKNQIYLEKNPPSGIWGGLWTLPSTDQEDDWQSSLSTKYAIHFTNSYSIGELHHTFSHFKLHIQAVAIEISALGKVFQECNGQWLPPKTTDHLGIARPIQILINRFNEIIAAQSTESANI